MLQVQGYTKNTFKKELKDNLTVEKTLAKIQEGINPTDEEINKYMRIIYILDFQENL